MIAIERLYRLLDADLSLITIGENKTPNFPWKPCQTQALSKEVFKKNYEYKGDIQKNDGTYIPATKNVGIVTGYNGLECIDVDLKVFSSLQEQQAFWSELLSFLQDNIDDFNKKFVIYKTQNQGYHIIYRCSVIEGNKKIAKLKEHKECVIESRGIGGYIFVYENNISELTYSDIKEITELDRQILWSCCRVYNYQTEEIILDEKVKEDYKESNIKTWDDYNAKTSIFDIIGSELKIVRTISDRYIVKRNGASSPHSGYVYKNTGCLYLFSTGTIYPNEKLISPFVAYTYKNHNGNFKAAASDLYKQGFGSRIVKKIDFPVIDESITKDLTFPIDIFPKDLQSYIIECKETLDSSIDYMGCSLLWVTSVIVGNSMHVKVKSGWTENAAIWIALVGKAGIGKTPSINNMIYPLQKSNTKEIKKYIRGCEKFEVYNALDKKDKTQYEEVTKPKKTQFIANDITLEALVDLHQESKNSIGVFKDELNGWFKDMNKYRAGSDLEFWLSSWSGKSAIINRKTAKNSFVDKPMIPVLGGIQPNILNSAYTDENKDNGFVDRMLLSFPDLEVEPYNEKNLSEELIEWYCDNIIFMYEDIKNNCVKYDDDGEVIPKYVPFSESAQKEWQRIYNEITIIQNSDEENEYMKSMLPKQKSYIPRFALLINTLCSFFNEGCDFTTISKESIFKAERLSKYFIAMAKKIKVNSIQVNEIKTIVKSNKDKTTKEVVLEMYRANPNFNKKEVAEIMGITRQTIHNWIK
jgi:hypothetical protein